MERLTSIYHGVRSWISSSEFSTSTTGIEDGWCHIDIDDQGTLEQRADHERVDGALLVGRHSTMQGHGFKTEFEATHFQFVLDSDKRYLAGPTIGRFRRPAYKGTYLLTLIPLPGRPTLERAEVDHILHPETIDDVSREEFLQYVFFYRTSDHDCRLGEDLKQYLSQHQIQHGEGELQLVDGIRSSHRRCTEPVGPFVCSDNELRPVCRLYDDHAAAIFWSLEPFREDQEPFRILRSTGQLAQSSSVAVPSRLTFAPPSSPRSPILNSRILVKDIFALQGLRQSACNRAYLALSEPEPKTAPLIQRLVNRGAHIIGTSKLSSMISREEPAESLEFQVPFNPRGDGFQSPAGSSSGAAAAIASYPWLDYSIGSDSTGSSRRPAFVNGCFALRLSQDPRLVEGLLPCFPIFDALALFSRRIEGMASFVGDWCDLQSLGAKPPRLVVIEEYRLPQDTAQMQVVDAFLKDLEHCGVQTERLSLAERWSKSAPDEAAGGSLYDFLADAGRRAFFYDFYHSTGEFREKYSLTQHGKTGGVPAVNRVTAFRWEAAQRITLEQRNDAVRTIEIYGRWLCKELFSDTEHETMIVLPVATAGPNYRDAAPSEPFAQEAWDQLFLAPITRSPEVTVPIGSVKFKSEITKRQEALPVAVSLTGAPGHDIDLIETVERLLKQMGGHLEVFTGPIMW